MDQHNIFRRLSTIAALFVGIVLVLSFLLGGGVRVTQATGYMPLNPASTAIALRWYDAYCTRGDSMLLINQLRSIADTSALFGFFATRLATGIDSASLHSVSVRASAWFTIRDSLLHTVPLGSETHLDSIRLQSAASYINEQQDVARRAWTAKSIEAITLIQSYEAHHFIDSSIAATPPGSELHNFLVLAKLNAP